MHSGLTPDSLLSQQGFLAFRSWLPRSCNACTFLAVRANCRPLHAVILIRAHPRSGPPGKLLSILPCFGVHRTTDQAGRTISDAQSRVTAERAADYLGTRPNSILYRGAGLFEPSGTGGAQGLRRAHRRASSSGRVSFCCYTLPRRSHSRGGTRRRWGCHSSRRLRGLRGPLRREGRVASGCSDRARPDHGNGCTFSSALFFFPMSAARNS